MTRHRKTLPALAAAMTSALAFATPVVAGDPVPGVDVLLEQIPGGSVHTASIDANGNIQFGRLPPGTYRVYQDLPAGSPAPASGAATGLRIAGPARFTASSGSDIGTLVVTGSQPVSLARIPAQPAGGGQAGSGGVPLSAESLNSTRSNDGGITAPAATATVRAMSPGEVRALVQQPGTLQMQAAPVNAGNDDDAVPLSAESLNSGRSNSSMVIDRGDGSRRPDPD